MTVSIRPGAVLASGDAAAWIVLSISDGRALCADAFDDFHCKSFELHEDLEVLPQTAADKLIAAIRLGAQQLDAKAARLEEEARSARVGAERIRVQLEIVERLIAAGGAR